MCNHPIRSSKSPQMLDQIFKRFCPNLAFKTVAFKYVLLTCCWNESHTRYSNSSNADRFQSSQLQSGGASGSEVHQTSRKTPSTGCIWEATPSSSLHIWRYPVMLLLCHIWRSPARLYFYHIWLSLGRLKDCIWWCQVTVLPRIWSDRTVLVLSGRRVEMCWADCCTEIDKVT